MKIEIRIIEDVKSASGRLLEIVETQGSGYERTQEAAVAAMLRHARTIFGYDNYQPVVDTSIFGGYYRHVSDGRCIVAR